MYLLLFLTIVIFTYFIVDRPIGKTHILKTKLDDRIPLVPQFSIPYLLFLPALLGTIFYAYIVNVKFGPLGESICIVYLFSYLIYIVYQTHVPRPKIAGNDVYTKLVKWIYTRDKPYNCLPSTHSSGATILAVYYFSVSSSLGWVAAIISLLIILSTLFVKQHYVPDAVSGVILGLLVSLIVFKV